MVVLAAGAARTHHQNSVGTEHLLVGIFDAGGPGAAALTSWGVSAPGGIRPAAGHIPNTGEDEEGPRGQPAPDGPARARGDATRTRSRGQLTRQLERPLMGLDVDHHLAGDHIEHAERGDLLRQTGS
ncbi:putative ATP-dependent Clp protease ATP-binding subunit (plasmid) [Rhodococcus sp. WAY2]|nr:putative ATP-dependent Clp protease ATP-binding subunit [Rhodococcus sp. WAY2]